METDINKISDSVYQLACKSGFHPEDQSSDAFVEAMCNNLHDEVSELHEAWRNNRLYNACDKDEEMRRHGLPPLTCLQEQLADIIIRCLDNAKHLGIDIVEAINVKHKYNQTRAFRHENKRS